MLGTEQAGRDDINYSKLAFQFSDGLQKDEVATALKHMLSVAGEVHWSLDSRPHVPVCAHTHTCTHSHMHTCK